MFYLFIYWSSNGCNCAKRWLWLANFDFYGVQANVEVTLDVAFQFLEREGEINAAAIGLARLGSASGQLPQRFASSFGTNVPKRDVDAADRRRRLRRDHDRKALYAGSHHGRPRSRGLHRAGGPARLHRSADRARVETAGHFDMDAELKVWISGQSSPIEKELNK